MKHTLALIVPEDINPNKKVWFHGPTVEDVLQQLHEWAFFENDAAELDSCTFQLDGDHRLYEFKEVPFHYCFDHGRISVDELLEEVCYEE